MKTKVASLHHPTKQRLLDAGMALLLKHGYNDLGLDALLQSTAIPKGSFYHHFKDKEDFAIQVIDRYFSEAHAGLRSCLEDTTRPPLQRVRRFFELTEQKYRAEGYMGCLLGGLGQELSGINDTFREKIEGCFAQIAEQIANCLEEARKAKHIPARSNPGQMASLLVNCWEGAALRSRLRKDPASLTAMLDFYFSSIQSPAESPTRRTRKVQRSRARS